MYKHEEEFLFQSLAMQKMLQTSRPDQSLVGRNYGVLFTNLADMAGITKSVEIGAFEAGFSMARKRKYPDLPAIAFEANPYVAEKFGPGCIAAGVDYRHRCVADKDGVLEIMIPRDFRGGARPQVNQMSSIRGNLSTVNSETVEVRSVVLDKAIDLKVDDTLLLWIDVEGALDKVLPHSKKALEQTALINIEVEARAIWDGQWLDSAVGAFLSEQGFVFVARDMQSINQYNCIFANPAMFDLAGARSTLANYLCGLGYWAP